MFAVRKSVRGASNMQSQFTCVEQSLLSQLECPVCMEYMRPPITFCVKGHNICIKCRLKVPHCPVCRQQLLNTRNLALEQLANEVKYPCAYRKYGCKEIYSLDLIGEHQDKCQYIPQACLVHKLNLGICTWTGITTDMKTHLKQAHSDLCMDYCPNPYYDLNPFLISGVTPATKYCKVIFSYNVLFYCCCEIQNGVFYAVLQYIGPAEEAAKYQYKVILHNEERTESLTFTRLARGFHENVDEIRGSGDCVKFHADQFEHFVDKNSRLTFSMGIIAVERKCTYGIGYQF